VAEPWSTPVAVDGTWKLTMSTPIGARPATLSLASEGDVLTGTQSAEGQSGQIAGTVNGNAVAWKVSITNPMPMTVEFVGTVDGDAISGSMTAGAFGTWRFTGVRA
jgi:hypothetical protein